jgi:Na+-transporting NADH:ubiquinone oxidoreductase subunit NqrC
LGKSTVIVVVALALSLAGSMVVANRQVEIHQLQSQLLQDQSTYAEQVGTMTNVSTPSQIASQASVLHLVDPVSVIQVPSTSLDAPLPLPKFTGYAPVTSRTTR